MSGKENQMVVNAETKADIKHIRSTLDDMVISLRDLKQTLTTTSTMAFETKLKVAQIEKDMVEKVDVLEYSGLKDRVNELGKDLAGGVARYEHTNLRERISRIEKILIGLGTLVISTVITAILSGVIKLPA